MDFLWPLKPELPELKVYAKEHRAGNDANRRKLDRAIGVLLQKSLSAIQRALDESCDSPEIEKRRIENKKQRDFFTKYTSVMKYIIFIGTAVAIVLAMVFGSGSEGAKTVYKCYAIAIVPVAAATLLFLYRLKSSTKEFIIESLIQYDAGAEEK